MCEQFANNLSGSSLTSLLLNRPDTFCPRGDAFCQPHRSEFFLGLSRSLPGSVQQNSRVHGADRKGPTRQRRGFSAIGGHPFLAVGPQSQRTLSSGPDSPQDVHSCAKVALSGGLFFTRSCSLRLFIRVGIERRSLTSESVRVALAARGNEFNADFK